MKVVVKAVLAVLYLSTSNVLAANCGDLSLPTISNDSYNFNEYAEDGIKSLYNSTHEGSQVTYAFYISGRMVMRFTDRTTVIVPGVGTARSYDNGNTEILTTPDMCN